MPVYHNKYGAPGDPPTVFRPELLQARGPIVQVQLEPPPPLVKNMVSAGQTAPSPITGAALIDTGASISCIDKSIPSKLFVNPVGVTNMAGAKGAGPSALFPIRVVILGMGNWTVDFQYLAEADLSPLGYAALLGRDLLRRVSLQYMGITGEYTVSV